MQGGEVEEPSGDTGETVMRRAALVGVVVFVRFVIAGMSIRRLGSAGVVVLMTG